MPITWPNHHGAWTVSDQNLVDTEALVATNFIRAERSGDRPLVAEYERQVDSERHDVMSSYQVWSPRRWACWRRRRHLHRWHSIPAVALAALATPGHKPVCRAHLQASFTKHAAGQHRPCRLLKRRLGTRRCNACDGGPMGMTDALVGHRHDGPGLRRCYQAPQMLSRSCRCPWACSGPLSSSMGGPGGARGRVSLR